MPQVSVNFIQYCLIWQEETDLLSEVSIEEESLVRYDTDNAISLYQRSQLHVFVMYMWPIPHTARYV